jgi:hypothetical protein
MKHDNRNKIIGGKHRAECRYTMLIYRTTHTEQKKNRNYSGVRVLIDKDTFVKWFMENDFEGASVDRIDKTKDYSLDNIQLIPLAENIRKDKVKAKDGMCECYKCKEVKPLEMFALDNRRANGHSTICKKCDSERRKQYATKVKDRKGVI